MAIFDDIFESGFLFDSEYRQRRDIQQLQQQVARAPATPPQLQGAALRIDQLELLCSALVELLVAKGLTTPAELRVLMQQVDLADGVEDGRQSKHVHDGAPRCASCKRFINPHREACVYCGTPKTKAQAEPGVPAPKPRADVECKRCSRLVPEGETYFTGRGLVCSQCFAASGG
jgi:RNA polymerase subunit RPABC4/transcription elongation factor Spt4